MQRDEWLAKRLKIAEERMDKLFSTDYDDHWGEIEQPHQEMIKKLLELLPPNPFVLDAACGTGKYWPQLIEGKVNILGIDHSAGMLGQAKKKFPNIQTMKIKLHKLEYEDEFDAIICVDAMENIFPEHWPIILQNFTKSLKNNGYLYFTVEILPEEELQENFKKSQADGIPTVYGEHIEKGGFGGYHYYPDLKQANKWLIQAKMKIVLEDELGYYHHYLTLKEHK